MDARLILCTAPLFALGACSKPAEAEQTPAPAAAPVAAPLRAAHFAISGMS